MPNTRVPVRFVVVIQSVVIPSLLVINLAGRFLTTGSTADGRMYHSRLSHGMFPDCDSIIAETRTPILWSFSSSKGKDISWYSWRANFLTKRDHVTCAHPYLPIQSSLNQSGVMSSREVDGVTWLHHRLCSEALCPPGCPPADLCLNVKAPFTWLCFVSPCASLYKNLLK